MRTIVLRMLALLIVGGGAYGGWLFFDAKAAWDRPLALGDSGLVFVVERGKTLRSISKELSMLGVLEQPEYLVWLGRLDKKAGRIKAGEYQIPNGTTPRELLKILIRGKVVQYAITFVEGWTFKEMLAAVLADPHLNHVLESTEPSAIMAAIGAPNEHPEGRFFPDTYHFPKGTTDLSLLKRAYKTMANRLAREWDKRDKALPYANPYDALIMASIIEKETGLASERSEISGVFVRRLNRGMRLQTDPTVIYGLGDTFDGNLRRVHLRQKTPYNTYVIKGLTPTPICLPGQGAIHAALHPKEGDAIFFVAKGDGSHHFSATYDEHKKAVYKYQIAARRARKAATQ
ncbi:MAG: endolytic transglycosylase MltG [Gammaproteobacteria bacterium]|nr:endolytic transglycosylase MltG [Gammaproteobacteria bacterium]